MFLTFLLLKSNNCSIHTDVEEWHVIFCQFVLFFPPLKGRRISWETNFSTIRAPWASPSSSLPPPPQISLPTKRSPCSDTEWEAQGPVGLVLALRWTNQAFKFKILDLQCQNPLFPKVWSKTSSRGSGIMQEEPMCLYKNTRVLWCLKSYFCI